MARVEIKDNQLVVNMKGIRKFATMKSELAVPLSQIKSIEAINQTSELMPALLQRRILIGTNFPGYAGGIFDQEEGRVFYDLKKGDEAIVVELKQMEDFSRIIIGVEDAQEVTSLLNKEIIAST
ncbi:MAG: hypothetical protein LBV67_03565 [Streptococcaceae bacterium]|jgi:hypothetical protein|nr:hypothetical protein [Streptococcaceae bacterium]